MESISGGWEPRAWLAEKSSSPTITVGSPPIRKLAATGASLPVWRPYRKAIVSASIEDDTSPMTKITAGIRNTLVWLLNAVVALFGTAVVEAAISRFFHPHTITDVLVRTYALSAAIAFVLGFFVYRQWKPSMARWVGLGGLCWFLLGAFLSVGRRSLWDQMSGTACEYGLQAIGCRNWFVFTLPALRAVLYSLGALLCWRVAAHGTSALEDALLLRFPRASVMAQKTDSDSPSDDGRVHE